MPGIFCGCIASAEYAWHPFRWSYDQIVRPTLERCLRILTSLNGLKVLINKGVMMKKLLLTLGLLLVSFTVSAESEETNVSEKERQEFSEGYLNIVQTQREGNLQGRLEVIREHEKYMRTIDRGTGRWE